MSSQDPPLEQWPTADLGWRILLYALLLVQVLAIGSFIGPVFFPDLFHGKPYFTMGLAITSFLGLLMWSGASVLQRPLLTRFALRCVVYLCLLWCASPILLGFSKSDLGAKRQDDVRSVFRELVAEGTLTAPQPEDAFTIGSRHGTTFSISYTNVAGEPRHYFVSDDFERFWKFRNMADRSEIKRPARYSRRD